jgi:F0F1-type ATP synthase assembly protein I
MNTVPPSDPPERDGSQQPPSGPPGLGKPNSLGSAGKYAGLGLQFVVAILLFLYVGQWLDEKLGTEPVFLYVGVFVGAGAAFFSMYRMLMADLRREEEAKKNAGPGK